LELDVDEKIVNLIESFRKPGETIADVHRIFYAVFVLMNKYPDMHLGLVNDPAKLDKQIVNIRPQERKVQ
jgi:hypothetical protein